MHRLPATHDHHSSKWLAIVGALAVVVVAWLVITPAAAARTEIPVVDELAFCNGQPVTPIDGVLQLNSSCVFDLQITWLPGMKQADVEFSSDGGASWQRDPVPLLFPTVPPGEVSTVASGACDAGLPTGTYLFRAHGFHSPNENGDVFSAPFPYSVSLTCP